MADTYTVNITMDQNTVNSLQNNGYYLYGFKAVASAASGGAPLVWFETQTYGLTTSVSWETQYQAYTSQSAIIPNGQIVASNSYNANLGQTLNVTNQAGTGTVVAGGTEGAISILNQTSTQMTCGISELQNGESKTLCAFPLFGNNMDVIAPIEKVLLTFATQQVNTGTVIEKSFASSFFIDMTGAVANTREVSYDLNTSWSCDGCAWAEFYPPNAELVPLLIESA